MAAQKMKNTEDAKKLIRELAYTLYSFGILQEGKEDFLPLVKKAYDFLEGDYGFTQVTGIPLSERNPSSEELDGTGRCWYGAPDRPGAVASWDLEEEPAIDDTHYLPHWALSFGCPVKVNEIKEEEPKWLPIDTAPKDGTVIFAACLECHNSQLFWNKEFGAWEDFVDSGRFHTPLAWFPIPLLSEEERKVLQNSLREIDD